MSTSQSQSKTPFEAPSTTTDLSTVEKMLLCFCAEGGARPMAGWKSCSYYERMVQKGYVEEVPEANVMFRRFKLTDAGRAKIVEMTNGNRQQAPQENPPGEH